MAIEKSRAYQKLLDIRANTIDALKFHEIKVNAITDDMQIEALSRLNVIENAYEKFNNIGEQLERHEEFQFTDLTIRNEDVVDIYITTSAKLRIIAKDILEPSILNSTQNRMSNTNNAEVKLPQISIPVFSGDYQEWTSFFDAFSSLVDHNNSLSDVSKMHYLRSSLKGDALRVINRLPVTEANYRIALKSLVERFQNKRAIVNKCLNTFINQPSMKNRNAQELRSLIDTTKEALQCIESLNVCTDEWNPFVVFIVQSKMDDVTKREYESYLGGASEIPKYKLLNVFLETQFRILDGSSGSLSPYIHFHSNSSANALNNKSKNQESQMASSANSNQAKNQSYNNEKCQLCSGNHWLLMCQQFIDWSPSQRKDFALTNKICIVCLHSHEKDQCRSKYRCKKCNGAHSVKLHTVYDDIPNTSIATETPVATIQERNSIFATALVKVMDKFGAKHILRVFIDMGSGGEFISERAAQILGLPRKSENKQLTGLDNVPLGKSTNSVRIQVESIVDESFKITIKANVMRTIIQPCKFQDTMANWNYLSDIQLADPEFLNPSHIDLLFGVDIYGQIIKEGIRKGLTHEPVAQNSHLGWLILGANSKQNSFQIEINSISIEEELKQLWENEEIAQRPIMSLEHSKCVEHFNNTHKRLNDGSFMVSLPFNFDRNDPNFLGESKKQALCRLFQIEKRFKRDPLYKKRYDEEIKGYITKNHMTLCENDSNDGYYMPHHAIVRENRTTTKQRIVFDASAKSTNGFSLNDRCHNGPTIQPELIEIFIRWRWWRIAFLTDVEKMYRMVKMSPEDRKFQKILYRFSETERIRTYKLNTVTFGTKPAPYMAIATTFALADAEKDKYPEAAKRVKKECYVDDCLSGNHCIKSTIQLRNEMDNLFKSGGFLLRKWASNEQAVLENIPKENLAMESSFEMNKNQSIKTLGLVWTPKTDELSFTIDMTAFHNKKSLTKRQLLSNASKIFDPCGFLSPITIKAKITMQDIWKSGTDWDNVVPKEIQSEWDIYQNDLPLIERIKIKRWLNTAIDSEVTLHGFCDSSEKAMACVIYLVQKSNNKITSSLVCSKTKVAPIATQSIPRLELNGAVLLAKLMNKTARNMNIKKIHLWTDSSIVLTWLNSHASRWQPYVGARVRNIQELYDASHWQHVRTNENPADIASRGVLPRALIENNLWFHGPSWLLLNETHWPKLEIVMKPNENLEAKSNIQVNMIQMKPNIVESEILNSFTSFNSLVRITAIILRFVNNCKNKETMKYSKRVIKVDEMVRAEMFWIKYVQQLHFRSEIKCIKLQQSVSEKSSIKELNPQFNENEILIVHGRLQYAEFSPLRKFPIILPAKSNLSKLAIEKAHTRSIHGSIHLTLATLRQEYWVVNARNMVKTHIHKCLTCYRQKPKPLSQLMAPLPQIKTKPMLPFMHTGMDFAGPFDLKVSTRRNASTNKGYVCVFVCMVSKAVHLEPVSDLSTNRFIGAFRSFISRRGLCSNVYCDQGTNFKGASNELPLLFVQAESQVSEHIQNLFANDRIKFNFNPPSAPHWGGQWESYVKLTKHHLNRISVSVRLTFEDMHTLLTQIEACINSRPLCAITSDVNDLDPITAGHLLTGRALNLIPEPSLLSLKDTTLDMFQAIQKGVQNFWKRFYIEYLHTMHPRKKWYKPGEELKINDLVVIIDDNLPPAKWLMGRVVEIHPGNDGLIRMATIQTKTKEENYGEAGMKKKPPTLQRPIAKLCKLPIANALPPPTDQQGGGEDVPNCHSEQ